MKGSYQRIILYFVGYKMLWFRLFEAFVLDRFSDGFLVFMIGMFTILKGWIISVSASKSYWSSLLMGL